MQDIHFLGLLGCSEAWVRVGNFWIVGITTWS